MASLTCAGSGCDTELASTDLACPVCGLPRRRARVGRSTAKTRDDATQVVATSETGPCAHLLAESGAVTCPTCGEVLPHEGRTPDDRGRVVLEFPWGDVELFPDSELELGREVGPFASELAAYPTVSRRHAVVRRVRGGGVLLEDQRSTNGTYRNGAKIPPITPVEVAVGDDISISTKLSMRIRSAS